MATSNSDFNWDEIDITDEVVTSHQVIDVPDAIVALAQKSYDTQSLRQATLKTAAQAAEFARLLKGAGDHTTPVTSMYVKQDGNSVRYRAGNRRGRKAGDAETAAETVSE